MLSWVSRLSKRERRQETRKLLKRRRNHLIIFLLWKTKATLHWKFPLTPRFWLESSNNYGIYDCCTLQVVFGFLTMTDFIVSCFMLVLANSTNQRCTQFSLPRTIDKLSTQMICYCAWKFMRQMEDTICRLHYPGNGSALNNWKIYRSIYALIYCSLIKETLLLLFPPVPKLCCCRPLSITFDNGCLNDAWSFIGLWYRSCCGSVSSTVGADKQCLNTTCQYLQLLPFSVNVLLCIFLLAFSLSNM